MFLISREEEAWLYEELCESHLKASFLLFILLLPFLKNKERCKYLWDRSIQSEELRNQSQSSPPLFSFSYLLDIHGIITIDLAVAKGGEIILSMQENLICSAYEKIFFLKKTLPKTLALLPFARCLPVYSNDNFYICLYLFIFLPLSPFNGQRGEIEGINLELLMQ